MQTATEPEQLFKESSWDAKGRVRLSSDKLLFKKQLRYGVSMLSQQSKIRLLAHEQHWHQPLRSGVEAASESWI